MPEPIPNIFAHCPRCAAKNPNLGSNPFHCAKCDLLYYFNPAIAVAGVITDDEGRVLLLRRAHDPGKGKLGLPGGFVDPGESPEDALVREVKEEVNLTVRQLYYIISVPNTYHFREVTYSVADIFYACEIDSIDAIMPQASEIDGYVFCHPTEKELSQMAFVSNRRAVEVYLQQTQKNGRQPGDRFSC